MGNIKDYFEADFLLEHIVFILIALESSSKYNLYYLIHCVPFNLPLSYSTEFTSLQLLSVFLQPHTKTYIFRYSLPSCFRCPWVFHFKTCFVMFMFASLRACHIPSPYSLCVLMLTSTGWCLDIFYNSTLLIVLGHLFFRIFLRHFPTNTWTGFMDVDVSIQVSDP